MWEYIKSKATRAAAVLILICGGVKFSEAMQEYDSYLMAFCATMTALGFLAAKPINVTNAPSPLTTSVVVPPPVSHDD